MVCLHTPFSASQQPHAPEARGLLLDHDLGHLVGAILQVVTPPPAASSGLLLLLQHVAYLGVSGIESSRQRPAFFPRVGLGCGTFTRESVSRVTRSCEKRTDADALTGPPSCSARLRRSALHVLGHFQLRTLARQRGHAVSCGCHFPIVHLPHCQSPQGPCQVR